MAQASLKELMAKKAKLGKELSEAQKQISRIERHNLLADMKEASPLAVAFKMAQRSRRDRARYGEFDLVGVVDETGEEIESTSGTKALGAYEDELSQVVVESGLFEEGSYGNSCLVDPWTFDVVEFDEERELEADTFVASKARDAYLNSKGRLARLSVEELAQREKRLREAEAQQARDEAYGEAADVLAARIANSETDLVVEGLEVRVREQGKDLTQALIEADVDGWMFEAELGVGGATPSKDMREGFRLAPSWQGAGFVKFTPEQRAARKTAEVELKAVLVAAVEQYRASQEMKSYREAVWAADEAEELANQVRYAPAAIEESLSV